MPGARRREEPHDRAAGRRHRHGGRRGRVSAAYGSAGERCMAISQVVAVGDAADPLVEAIKERLPKIKVGDGIEPDVEMGPLVTREHRDKVASYIERRARRRARRSSRTAARAAPDGDGFFLGVVAARQRDARDGRLQGRDLRAGARRHARRHVRRGGAARQREPVRERDGDLHARRRRRAAVPVRRAGRDGRDQRADPGAGRVLLVRRLEELALRRPHIYGPEGINFYTRGKVVTSRWPDPATSKVDLGFPQTR